MTEKQERPEGELTALVGEMMQVASDCYNLSLETNDLVDMLKLNNSGSGECGKAPQKYGNDIVRQAC